MLVPKEKWKPCELYAPGSAPLPNDIEIIPIKPDIPDIVIEIDPPLPEPSNKLPPMLPPGVLSGEGIYGQEPNGPRTKPEILVRRSLIRWIPNGRI